MKKLNASHLISNIVLTLLLTLSGIGCLVTAFDLTVDVQEVLRTAVIWSILFCFGFSRLWSMALLVVALPLYMVHLSYTGLPAHLESALWNISTLYNRAYSLGYTIWWTTNDHLGADTTCFFQLLAVFSALVAGAGLTRQRVWPAMLMGVGMLLPCVVVVDTVPDTAFFFLWLFAMLLLALSALVRRSEPKKAAHFLARVCLPSLLSLAILFAAIPKDSYTPPESNWLIELVEYWETLQNPSQSTEPGGPPMEPSEPVIDNLTVKNIDLTAVGPKKNSVSRKLTLLTDYSGYVYLRGTEYTVYTGGNWYIQEGSSQVEMDSSFLQNTRQTTYIRYDKTDIRLLPYYVPGTVFTDGAIPISDGVQECTEYSYPLLGTWAAAWEERFGKEATLSALPTIISADPDLASYTDLPAVTRRGAASILAKIGCSGEDSALTVAQKIGNYVQSSATYSLQTRRMPEGEADFALWFLEESETGYCVHFATAATVLLRAAGIPARFVEGYLSEVTANKSQSVVGGDAHAWVEYYLPGAGWVILEATPGMAIPEIQPTEPSTEPSAIPTEPTEPSTAPTEPTEPSTEPTEPVDPPGPGRDLSGLWTVFKGILWIAGGVLLLLAQWRLRLYWLQKRLTKGSPNRQAITRWRHSSWLSRISGVEMPEQLLALAKKAKFSQHTITAEELQQFQCYHGACVTAMRTRNILLQGIYRFIFALY